MDIKLRSKLQVALKEHPDLEISEAHLMQTIHGARLAYQNRRHRERIRYPDLLLRQVRFIGANVWLIQGLLLLCALWLFGFRYMGSVSNFELHHLPVLLGCFAVFIAMTGIPYIGRSAQHKMLEIEMATRVSVPKLLLVRIFIVGIGNMLLLTISIFLVRMKGELSTMSIALYLLLPYFIASCGCLLIQSYANGKQQGFISIAYCFSLTALLFVLYKTIPAVYEQAFAPAWGALCAVFALIIIIGIYRLLYKAASLDLSLNGI